MPYYDETFVNRSEKSPVRLTPTVQPIQTNNLDFVSMRSFRSRPSPLAKASSEVLDHVADPYAYFLANTNQERYAEQLKLRGLPSSGDPDRGHSFLMNRSLLAGRRFDVTRRSSSGTFSEFFGNAIILPDKGMNGTLSDSVHNGQFKTQANVPTVVDKYGQTAYAKVAPTTVVFDAAQFLGELREGLPRISVDILKGGLQFFKGLGSNYLSLEFGWKPFLDDIQNAAQSLISATKAFDSSKVNRRVHRRHRVPQETASWTEFVARESLHLQCGWGPNAGFAQTSLPVDVKSLYSKTFSRDLWFEGEFTSFLPLGFDPNDFLQRADQLINTKVTPAVLWELTPWSWLVDWSLKIQDSIVANQLAANDLLVMHYGYAMEHVVCTTSVQWDIVKVAPDPWSLISGVPTSGGYLKSDIRKSRVRANPYGFKVGGWGGLSTHQASILGALGLSQGIR